MRDEKIEFKIVSNPKRSLLSHLNHTLDKIIPLGIGRGYSFQVRIDAKQFEALPERIKNTLKEACNYEHSYHKDDAPEEARRWIEEHYWTPCDAYIFDYTANGYHLTYNELYGYDGLEECDTLYFLNPNHLPKLVWKNRNTREKTEEQMFKV